MIKAFTRFASLTVLTAVALFGLMAVNATEAAAQPPVQMPCAGVDLTFRYTTDDGPFTPCGGSATFMENYDVLELYSYGPAGSNVTATTCLSGNNLDSTLELYQEPTGAQGAFDPTLPCVNRLAFNDDAACAVGPTSLSTILSTPIVQGYYTVVITNWWGTQTDTQDVLVTNDAVNCVLVPNFDGAAMEILGDPLTGICLGRGLDITIGLENTGNGTLDNGANPEYSVTVAGVGCPVGVASITSGSVGPGSIPGAAPLGGSATADLVIPVGGTDIIAIGISFPNGIGCLNSMLVQSAVWADVDAPNPGDGIVQPTELFEFEEEILIGDLCPPSVFPNNQLGCQVHLPILNFLGQDDLCESWIEVQNLGCDFAKASLVTWGEPGFCPPQAAGPLKVECTGLLKPGSTWNLLGAQIPNGSKSGILFKWTARQLSEIGVDLGFDDVVADYMCETLFFGVVGDADDYRRFKKAYNEGLEFGGVPMDRATGDGLIAVDVHRKCPGDVTPGVEVTSKYNGIAGTHLGTFDPVYGGHSYYVPLVYADKAGFTSIMYIQNGGLECTSVEVWFKTQDDCLRAKICDIATLAPGETYQLDANDCVGPDFQGSAWIRTTQPMGIAVDIVGRDVLMTYVAEPGEINYTFDPTMSLTKDGNQVAFGPLIYSEYQGWDTGVQVQNMSAVTAAKVKVYFMDRSGDIITTLVDWVCPRGSQTFFLPVIFDLPGTWVGSIRVESQEWITPGGPLVAPPNIVGVVTLIKYNDAARTETTEAIAYNLLPEHKIYDWQIGFGRGGLDSGVGLIAIPSLLKDLDGSGLTSELAIANVVPKPGFTDLAIYFFDQNGLLDYVCQKLGAKQVEYIDLQTWGYVNPGFKGSAIISAQFWEHDVFDDRGNFVRNLVGLGAVAVERNGTRLGEDAPGDEAAGARGIPFSNPRTEDEEDAGFEHCFMAAFPICPGTPFARRGAGDCAVVGSLTVNHIYTSDSSDKGGRMAYVLIPGMNDTRNGGVCGPAIPGSSPFHNWDFANFVTCGTGTLEATAVAITIQPFTGQSCFGGQGQVNGFLFNIPGQSYDLATGCPGMIQDAMVQNSGATMAFNIGDTKPYNVYEAQTHSFSSMNWCDITGNSTNTGNVTFDLNNVP